MIELDQSPHDRWYTSLKIIQQSHIASKIVSRLTGIDTIVPYPDSTNIWLNLSEAEKSQIHQHCLYDHAFLQLHESDGKTFSY